MSEHKLNLLFLLCRVNERRGGGEWKLGGRERGNVKGREETERHISSSGRQTDV